MKGQAQTSNHNSNQQHKQQSSTFQHLGPVDSLTYNWIKQSTTSDPDACNTIFSEVLQAVPIRLLELVAESPTVSTNTLKTLAHNRASIVRVAVADNAKTPPTTLAELAADPCDEVRYALAENHNIPEHVLEILMEDENPYVKARAQITYAKLRADRENEQMFG